MSQIEELDREFVEKIASLTKCDEATIKSVLRAILFTTSIEFQRGNNKMTIPFICDLTIVPKKVQLKNGDGTEIELHAEVRKGLLNEIHSVIYGLEPPTKKFMYSMMDSKFNAIAGVENKEVLE